MTSQARDTCTDLKKYNGVLILYHVGSPLACTTCKSPSYIWEPLQQEGIACISQHQYQSQGHEHLHWLLLQSSDQRFTGNGQYNCTLLSDKLPSVEHGMYMHLGTVIIHNLTSNAISCTHREQWWKWFAECIFSVSILLHGTAVPSLWWLQLVLHIWLHLCW